MAAVYRGERTFLDPIMRVPERFLHQALSTSTPTDGQDWKAYAKSLIIFSFVGWLLLYFVLRTQTLWSCTGLETRGLPLGPVERHLQHDLVVPDQHQLAVLRRRDHPELLQPDGGATVQNFLSARWVSSSPSR